MAEEQQTVNILLLGPSGVGKSTFINAFFNYLKYMSFEEAVNEGVECLIPAKFDLVIQDDDGNSTFHHVTLHQTVSTNQQYDSYENFETGESSTQECLSYLFTIRKESECFKVRLIDTPGVVDTRGADQDGENFEKILYCLSHFDYLHAICILLKPDEPRLSPEFEYCLNKLFSQLDKSAARNIIFALTRTRGTDYQPGATHATLFKLLDKVAKHPPHVRIQASMSNMFCFENDSFRYLAGLKNGVPFTKRHQKTNLQSWIRSVDSCWRMLDYIRGKNGKAGLPPHLIKDTMSVNNARKLIIQVSRPMADATEIIYQNMMDIERRERGLKEKGLTLEELLPQLKTKRTKIEVSTVPYPITVCGGPKCLKEIKINDRKVHHFPQPCHNPCYLKSVTRELIGDRKLQNCEAMSDGYCNVCKCSYQLHMHIYYTTKQEEEIVENEDMVQKITTLKEAMEHAEELLEKLHEDKKAYEEEQSYIVQSLAKFSYFLNHNAIVPYHDSYKRYFQYLIDRENSLGDSCNRKTVSNLEKMIAKYDEEKRILEAPISSVGHEPNEGKVVVTADEIKNVTEQLYNLKMMGPMIRTASEIQKTMQRKEYYRNYRGEEREYVLEKKDSTPKQGKTRFWRL